MEVTDKVSNNGECLFLIPPQLPGQPSVCASANTLEKVQVHKNRFTGNLCLSVQGIGKLTQVYKKSRPHWRVMN